MRPSLERDDGKATKDGDGGTPTTQGKGRHPAVSESITVSKEVEHGGPPALREGCGPADVPVERRAAHRRRSQADRSPGADSARSELRAPSAEKGDAFNRSGAAVTSAPAGARDDAAIAATVRGRVPRRDDRHLHVSSRPPHQLPASRALQ